MSIVTILNDNDLWQNVKLKKPFVFKNSNLPNVTWKEVMSIVYADLKIGKTLGQGESGRYDDFGFKVMKANRIESVQNQFEELKQFFNVSEDRSAAPGGSQLYISIETNQKSYGSPHSDPENVFFWQLLGKSNWKIWSEDNVSIQIDEILEPGDLLYCPPNLQHHIVAVTPRAGVSMAFGGLLE